MNEEPDHHRRYREAWEEYRTNFDKNRKLELEREMDSAQNHFSWDEFQAFKATLPGYVEYWQFLERRGQDAIKELRRRSQTVEEGEIWKRSSNS